jgi:hypothetical protein
VVKPGLAWAVTVTVRAAPSVNEDTVSGLSGWPLHEPCSSSDATEVSAMKVVVLAPAGKVMARGEAQVSLGGGGVGAVAVAHATPPGKTWPASSAGSAHLPEVPQIRVGQAQSP